MRQPASHSGSESLQQCIGHNPGMLPGRFRPCSLCWCLVYHLHVASSSISSLLQTCLPPIHTEECANSFPLSFSYAYIHTTKGLIILRLFILRNVLRMEKTRHRKGRKCLAMRTFYLKGTYHSSFPSFLPLSVEPVHTPAQWAPWLTSLHTTETNPE